MPKITIPVLPMHSAQMAVEASPARFKVLSNGRRWGKTLSSLEWLLFGEGGSAIEGKPVAFFAPTYQLMLEVWKDAERTLRNVTSKANKTENRIELITGGIIDFWTLQDDGAGRGRKYTRIVIDEAAHARYLKDTWEKAILPTLTDYSGSARIISTPNGRNYFWQLWQQGNPDNPQRLPDWQSFTYPTSSNPFIPPEEIEKMRALLPERVFAQEYLAAFLQEGAGVFRRVTDAVDQALPTDPHTSRDIQNGASYVIGVDWGRHNDFTVFTTIDARAGAVVAIDRFTDIDYAVQLSRLQALHQRFPKAPILAESNSMGGPLIEQLQRMRLPVQSFHTSSASKTQAVEALALAFENGSIHLPNVPWLIDELMAFDQERLPSGAMRYAAPKGGHDDGVMSLAIGWSGVAFANNPYKKTMMANAL